MSAYSHFSNVLTRPLVILFLILHFNPISAREVQPGNPEPAPGIALVAVGADSMAPMMNCWIDSFEDSHADITIRYKAALSADGAVEMLQHQADFSPFAREFFPLETEAFKAAFGQPAALIPVGTGSFDQRGKTHALAIWVHRDNPLASLSLIQLRQIFIADSDELNWGDAGLKGEWSSRPIRRFGMLNLRSSGNPPGIVNFMRYRINGHLPLSDDIRQLPGDESVHALQQIVDSVAADPLAIGYSGFLFENPGSKTVAVSFDESRTAIDGSVDNVRTHRYPLSRFVYLALNPAIEGSKREALTRFVKFTQSAQGQECLKDPSHGFYPLQAEVIAANKAEIDVYERAIGTRPAISRQDYRGKDGRIRVVGYNDMEPMLLALNERFKAQHPEVSFDLNLIGTRAARPALIDGSSAFAPMGAEFSVPAMEQYQRRHRSDPVAIRVAHAAINPDALSGPLAFFVHPDNPLDEISLERASRVFAHQHDVDNYGSWGQLGLDGNWNDRTIKPCGLRPGRALSVFLSEQFFSGAPYVENLHGFAQSTEAVEFASKNVNALCFAGYNRATSSAKALSISLRDGGAAYSVNEGNVINHQYPLTRHLYIYLRNVPGTKLEPVLRTYLELVLSRDGQKLIMESFPGYLPLNEGELRNELGKLALIGN